MHRNDDYMELASQRFRTNLRSQNGHIGCDWHEPTTIKTFGNGPVDWCSLSDQQNSGWPCSYIYKLQ